MKKKPYKLGLVLSGGGAKGFAHVGLLQALEEMGIQPDIIAGASVGSIVGALYADGYSIQEMLSVFKNTGFMDLVSPKLNANSILKTDNLQKKLKSLLHAKTFEELRIPLVISASNLTCGKVEYFRSGTLLDKVLASSSIPVLFNPVIIDGQYYADGGLFDNFPVEQIRDRCEYVIGFHLHPFKKQDKITTLKQNIERTITLVYESHGWKKAHLCNLYIEPEALTQYTIYDVRKAMAIYKVGYDYGRKMLEKADYFSI